MDYRGRGKPGLLRRYAGSERNYRIMLDNVENPYTTSPDTAYSWGRSRCLGGRTLHWARATDRMADYEFKAASRDGYGMDWAVSYADMKPYYDRVESFIGVSGEKLGLPQFPDGPFLPPMALNCAETIFTAACKSLGWHIDAPAAGAIDAPAQRPAGLPLLRQLRERLRRRRDVQSHRRHAAPGAQDGQPRDPHRQRRRARAHEPGEPRARRHLHRAAHDEVGGRRREVRHPGRLDAREHAAAAAVREGRSRQLERHPRAIHDGPGRRRRRQRNPAQAQGRTQPPRRRESGRHHDPELPEHRREDRSARTSSAAT